MERPIPTQPHLLYPLTLQPIALPGARPRTATPWFRRRRWVPEDAKKVCALGEPALEFPGEEKRFYPQGSLAAHVLGFVDEAGKGHVGMEQVLEPRLLDPAHRGTPTALSIDARAQGALEDELGRGMLETMAKGAAGVILDTDSGEVIALASLPSFNPNRSDLAYNDLVFNRLSNQFYEPGSTFKPITVASAIDSGVIPALWVRYPAVPSQIGTVTIHVRHDSRRSLLFPHSLTPNNPSPPPPLSRRVGLSRPHEEMTVSGFFANQN